MGKYLSFVGFYRPALPCNNHTVKMVYIGPVSTDSPVHVSPISIYP